MTTRRTTVEAHLVPVAVPLQAAPGDSLVIVRGVCVGVEKGHSSGGGVPEQPRPRTGGTPAEDFLDDLLISLLELKNPTPAKLVLDYMQNRITPKLRPADYDKLGRGEVRWRNRVQWARFLGVKEGLIENAARGIWALTEAGKRRAMEAANAEAARTHHKKPE